MKKTFIATFSILIITIIVFLTALFLQSSSTYEPREGDDEYNETEDGDRLENIAGSEFDDGRIVDITDRDPNLRSELEATINLDINSNIAMTAVADNGEAIVVITERVDEAEAIDKIVMVTAEQEVGVVELDDVGLPEIFNFRGYQILFSDYRAETVDLEVISPDGSRVFLNNSALRKFDRGFEVSLIDVARAEEFAVTVLPYSSQTRKEYIDSNGEIDGITEYLFTKTDVALSVITCGVGIATIIEEQNGLPSFIDLSCGAFISRGITNHAVIGPCQEGGLDCVVNSLFEIGIRRSPTIAGRITDAVTGEPIAGIDVVVHDSSQQNAGQSVNSEMGFYRLPKLNIGEYSISFIQDGETRAVYYMTTTESDVLILDSERNQLINQPYNLKDQNSFDRIPGYFGHEIEQTFNVRFDVSF